jgi:tetratricopeptide (TPR) repeat protein
MKTTTILVTTAVALLLINGANSQGINVQEAIENLKACGTGNEPQNLDTKITACTSFVQSGISNPDVVSKAYYNLADALSEKEDFEGAIKSYSKAVEYNPKYITAYNDRGAAYNKIGEYDKAISDLNEAVRLSPKSSAPHRNLGYSYFRKGDLDQSIEEYTQALNIRPKYAAALAGRGDAYRAKGDTENAAKDYESALVINPALTETRNFLEEIRTTQN